MESLETVHVGNKRKTSESLVTKHALDLFTSLGASSQALFLLSPPEFVTNQELFVYVLHLTDENRTALFKIPNVLERFKVITSSLSAEEKVELRQQISALKASRDLLKKSAKEKRSTLESLLPDEYLNALNFDEWDDDNGMIPRISSESEMMITQTCLIMHGYGDVAPSLTSHAAAIAILNFLHAWITRILKAMKNPCKKDLSQLFPNLTDRYEKVKKEATVLSKSSEVELDGDVDKDDKILEDVEDEGDISASNWSFHDVVLSSVISNIKNRLDDYTKNMDPDEYAIFSKARNCTYTRGKNAQEFLRWAGCPENPKTMGMVKLLGHISLIIIALIMENAITVHLKRQSRVKFVSKFDVDAGIMMMMRSDVFKSCFQLNGSQPYSL